MLPKIYCSNPHAQYNSYSQEIASAINSVCTKGVYVLGEEVSGFESEFAQYHNLDHCVGVGSGTDALVLTMKAMDIGPGDEIITTSHTALATVAAIVMTGATPVLADIEQKYYTINPIDIEAAITNNTKAIIPVHLYGQPCDMDAIVTIAQKYNLKIIEDCAQAHGAEYNNRKVGTIGDAGCFSFYPTKNLGAIGDGGGIVTNNTNLYNRLLGLRQYGWDNDRVSQEPSITSRLDELQAAILRIKLKFLDRDNNLRRDIADKYNYIFADKNLILPLERDDCKHVYHLYVIQAKNRNELQNKLAERNIQAGIHYKHPVHMHPGYKSKIKIGPNGLNTTEKTIGNILTLPIYPELDIDKITNILQDTL